MIDIAAHVTDDIVIAGLVGNVVDDVAVGNDGTSVVAFVYAIVAVVHTVPVSSAPAPAPAQLSSFALVPTSIALVPLLIAALFPVSTVPVQPSFVAPVLPSFFPRVHVVHVILPPFQQMPDYAAV